MFYQLDNEQICFKVDEYGRPLALYNHCSRDNYINSHDFWRMIISDAECLEVEIIPDSLPPEINVRGNEMTIEHQHVRTRFGSKQLNISVKIIISLHDDELNFKMELSNNHESMNIKEVHFPLLSIKDETLEGVVTTYTGGQYFSDVRAKIMKAHTQYKGIDHHYIRDVNCYPMNAMNCMLADRGHEGLYLGCHDPSFSMTAHILELENGRDFNMTMARFPYTGTGEKYSFSGFILSPYKGSWHKAADKYREWAQSWYKVPDRPEFIRKSNGWQRIIMRTQYGRVLFPYESLTAAFDDAMQAGIDTLFLFGWHRHGMDNGYPDYVCDDTQGGKEALKRNIKTVQNAGGKIYLYFNGQLIDRKSSFYQEGAGLRICSKLPSGEPDQSCYSFPGPGISAAKFGNVTFSTACPSSEEWLDILKGFIDQAIDLGVDSVFFDQIGSMGYPCCDPTHGHPVPYIGINDSRMRQLSALRDYLQQRCPQMGFGVEWLSDVTAQHVDFVHIWGNIAEESNIPGKHDVSFQEFFHYAFPEVIFSNREIRTDEDIERRVNLMLLKGCCSDVEIYRAQATIAETPCYSQYLAAANRLRQKYIDILVYGRFMADSYSHIIKDNKVLKCAAWEKDRQLALMITHDNAEPQSFDISLPEHEMLEYDSVRGDAEVSNNEKALHITLPRFSLLLLVLKNSGY